MNDVGVSLSEGEVVGLLGPNGSGKSTLMRILSGLIISWDGDIYLEGQSIRKSNTILKRSGFFLITLMSCIVFSLFYYAN